MPDSEIVLEIITMDFMYNTKISKSTPEFFREKTPIASQEETAGLAWTAVVLLTSPTWMHNSRR